jgi:hypothetical protein
MEKHNHLKLPLFKANVKRKKRGGGGGFEIPDGRNKHQFSQQLQQKSEQLSKTCADLKTKFPMIDSKLIFAININQSLAVDAFEKTLTRMDIHLLSVAKGKKDKKDKKGKEDHWVVFSDDQNLKKFKDKLNTYGSEEGENYDFFHAIESFGDIPAEEKMGEQLKQQPLDDTAEFVDIELWKMDDPQKNTDFITQLKASYPEFTQFRITDQLITKSFVLLRVKLTKQVFDDIIQLKEIARIDRPATVQFNPFEMMSPDIQALQLSAPDDNATGILIIDSGIVSNHPMLEKCVGGEDNFQAGENQTQDTVGHGTAVAGCAVYGDIGQALENKSFAPSNWLFSAKVMYAERDLGGNPTNALYDPKKLLEHQFKDAVESFLSNPEYHIKVVNISLGNADEVWHKDYNRQLPLAALIDELAFTFPHVVFIVSVGNQSPLNCYDSIADIKENYPKYLLENDDFKLINPATAALALTIGSIAHEVQIKKEHYGAEQIKTAIAQAHQPSPFTRTGLGINGMIKPELVEYGGNMILSEQYVRKVDEDMGGQLPLLNKQVANPIIRFGVGSSFSAPKVAHLAGRIANQYPDKSANFIKNMLLVGADYPFPASKDFYSKTSKKEAEQAHLSIVGYGLSQFDRAIHSFDNRAVLWDEGQITMNQLKVYSLQLPELFFTETGKKKIMVTLTFTPETRGTRGDSYLGNRMEFHLFHSVKPQVLIEKYGMIENNADQVEVPNDLKKFEIDFFPGSNMRKAGCHQKAWKLYQKEPKHRPASPISLVLLNVKKWISNDLCEQDYCISVVFEHEKEIALYAELQANIQTRTRIHS